MRLDSVLIIEDDENTLAILNLILSSDFPCKAVKSRDAALALLNVGFDRAWRILLI